MLWKNWTSQVSKLVSCFVSIELKYFLLARFRGNYKWVCFVLRMCSDYMFIDSETLTQTLVSLLNIRLLRTKAKGALTSSDVFKVNESFAPKLFRVKINPPQLQETVSICPWLYWWELRLKKRNKPTRKSLQTDSLRLMLRLYESWSLARLCLIVFWYRKPRLSSSLTFRLQTSRRGSRVCWIETTLSETRTTLRFTST